MMNKDESVPFEIQLELLRGAVRDSLVKGDVNIHLGGAGPREYCECGCGADIYRDKTFMCPDCHRKPVLESCRDKELGNCRICAEAWRSDERERGYCPRIALTVSLQDGATPPFTVFLLPRRTVQLGRACSDQLPQRTARDTVGGEFAPHQNDIICRVLTGPDGEPPREHVRSRMISRRHAAIRIVRERGRDIPMAIDCGRCGTGSEAGSFLGTARLPRGKWQAMSDDEALILGRHPGSDTQGLGIQVRALRNPGDRNIIDALVMERDDRLAKHQRWVMVAREAAIGLGGILPVPLIRDPEPVMAWGGIRVDGRRFILERPPNTPLGATEFAGSNGTPVVLTCGMEFSANRFRVRVTEISDRDFNRIEPEGA